MESRRKVAMRRFVENRLFPMIGIVILLVIVVVQFNIIWTADWQYKDEAETYMSENTKLQADVSNLNYKNGELSDEVESLEGDVHRLRERVTELTDVNNQKQAIADAEYFSTNQ